MIHQVHVFVSSRIPNPDLLVLKVGYERRGVPHDFKPRPVRMRRNVQQLYCTQPLSQATKSSCCSLVHKLLSQRESIDVREGITRVMNQWLMHALKMPER